MTDWVFQDSDFAGLKINLGEESDVFSEVEHLFPLVGCERSKRQ